MQIDASELNALVADLGRAPEKATAGAKVVVAKSLHAIEGESKAFAPVDTGNLRGSIGVDVDPDGLGGEAGPTANYGGFVERGTSKRGPAAFMGPAFDRAQPGFVSALEQVAADSVLP